MHIDLLTLYYLAIGTLLLSAGLTLGERRVQPLRRHSLTILAAGYGAMAAGCALATVQGQLPGASGAALSNLVTVSGYLLVLDGVASLTGRRFRTASLVMLGALALIWAVGGARWPGPLWSYVGAFPIAVASGMTAWSVLRSRELRSFRAGQLIVAITAGHALLYAARAFLLPVLAVTFGDEISRIVGKLTIYEGVLYSVGLPMTLLALIREEAHEQLLKASRTDHLTGLGNRRWFFEEGAQLLRTDGTPRPVSLLAIDLDHFKAINDFYGHAAGDEVLRSFARVAEGIFSPGTILARIGGEEFAALLPGHDAVNSKKFGEALAAAFTSKVALGFDGIPLTATISIGLADTGADGPDLEHLMSAADRALYVAKALGRNRIELARRASLAAAA